MAVPFQIIKGENHGEWIMIVGEGKEKTYITHHGSEKDALNKFFWRLKTDYKQDVHFKDRLEWIPIPKEDEVTGEIEWVKVPRHSYSIERGSTAPGLLDTKGDETKAKPRTILIKKKKEPEPEKTDYDKVKEYNTKRKN